MAMPLRGGPKSCQCREVLGNAEIWWLWTFSIKRVIPKTPAPYASISPKMNFCEKTLVRFVSWEVYHHYVFILTALRYEKAARCNSNLFQGIACNLENAPYQSGSGYCLSLGLGQITTSAHKLLQVLKYLITNFWNSPSFGIYGLHF